MEASSLDLANRTLPLYLKINSNKKHNVAKPFALECLKPLEIEVGEASTRINQ